MVRGIFTSAYQQQDPLLASTWGATSVGLNAMNGMNTPMFGGTQMPGMMSGMFNQGFGSALGNPALMELANNVHESMSPVPFFNRNGSVRAVLSKLAQENPQKLAALEMVYGQMYGAPDKLRKDLRHNLGGIRGFLGLGKPHCKEIDLLNQASRVSPYNAALGLNEAMKGLGTDERTVKDIMYNSPDDVLAQTSYYYRGISGGNSLQHDIKGDFLRWIEPQENGQ